MTLVCRARRSPPLSSRSPACPRVPYPHRSPTDRRGTKLVVSSAWLAEHLNDRDLVILQVGRKATYDAGHIPGARLVEFDAGALAAPMDHSGASPDHVMLEMPSAQALRDQLAALGISDNSRIVVVAGRQLLVTVDTHRPDARLRGPLERDVARRRHQGLDRLRTLADGRRPGGQARERCRP